MAAVTICSDFGAQKNKIWHCFHCLPIYLPWSDGTGCHELSFLNVEPKQWPPANIPTSPRYSGEKTETYQDLGGFAGGLEPEQICPPATECKEIIIRDESNCMHCWSNKTQKGQKPLLLRWQEQKQGNYSMWSLTKHHQAGGQAT